jgi:N-carbamoyl-L-amino-acid hydrolase
MEARITMARLKKNIEDLAGFGRTSAGGITRESFGDQDTKAKAWLIDKIEEAGLQARMDEAGNVWGRLGPAGPAVLAGSHLDTVPEGGMFDGALGILAALECLQTIQERGFPCKSSLEMVAFSEEEGAYLSFLGSRAITGSLPMKNLSETKNNNNFSLKQAMSFCGMSLERIERAKRDFNDIMAYMELHIEQGPTLESIQVPIGIVRAIVGIVCYWITFEGQASHAGTTPLAFRRDALLGAAEFCLRINDWARSRTTGVATVGIIDVSPGAFNIVPGKARLAIEFRDSSSEQLETMEKSILEIGRKIARERGLRFDAKRISWDEPIQLSGAIIDVIQAEADALGAEYRFVESGAGHDAQILAQKAKAGMIFIPSIGGRSHCAEEESRWSDIEIGAQLLLNCLLRLAN